MTNHSLICRSLYLLARGVVRLAILGFIIVLADNISSQAKAFEVSTTMKVMLIVAAVYTIFSLIWAVAHVGHKYRKEPWWEFPFWLPALGLGLCFNFVGGISNDFEKAWWYITVAMEARRTGIGYKVRLLVARYPNGKVALSGWDCTTIRKNAYKLLQQGLTIELVTPEEADRVGNLFSTFTPVGEVLTHEQAMNLLSGY